jgi:hypothetical protein
LRSTFANNSARQDRSLMSRIRAVALLVRVFDSIERQARAGSRTREPPDACGFQPNVVCFLLAREIVGEPTITAVDGQRAPAGALRD